VLRTLGYQRAALDIFCVGDIHVCTTVVLEIIREAKAKPLFEHPVGFPCAAFL
jgi:hypothetical protein